MWMYILTRCALPGGDEDVIKNVIFVKYEYEYEYENEFYF